MGTVDSLEVFVIVLIVTIIIFILFRNIILWYFNINHRVKQLEEIKAYLWFIAKSQNPYEFEKYLEDLNNRFPEKSSLEMDMEKLKKKYE